MGKDARGLFKSDSLVVPDSTVTPIASEEAHLLHTQCYCVCLPFEVTVGKCFIRNQFLGPLLLLVCNLQLWGLTYLFLCDCFVSTL